MRMWLVDPKTLCRKHLLGEHVEEHMFVGSINKGIRMKGYIEKKLVEVHKLRSRHEELVKEMQRRGYKHKSELPLFTEYVSPSVISTEENLKELAKRCEECKRLQEVSNGE